MFGLAKAMFMLMKSYRFSFLKLAFQTLRCPHSILSSEHPKVSRFTRIRTDVSKTENHVRWDYMPYQKVVYMGYVACSCLELANEVVVDKQEVGDRQEVLRKADEVCDSCMSLA